MVGIAQDEARSSTATAIIAKHLFMFIRLSFMNPLSFKPVFKASHNMLPLLYWICLEPGF
jgi:hypothetical protein